MCDLWWSLSLLLFIYNVFADSDPNANVLKQDDIDDFDDNNLMEGYKSHSDLKSKWQFVDRDSFPIEQAPFASQHNSPSKIFYKIPIQQSSTILLSLRNLGESAFNITSITGYIHAAHRFTFYVQNHTTRIINTVLPRNKEITLEYRLMPWTGLPLVDYVLSCDVEYMLIRPNNDGSDASNDELFEYKYKFMNVTINAFDATPMRWIDFELFFMAISVLLFWSFLGILFYEFWWIPNQRAQGLEPLATQEFVQLLFDQYAKRTFYVLRERLFNQPNPMEEDSKSAMNSTDGNGSSKKNVHNDWLTGTSASKKKKKKKN